MLRAGLKSHHALCNLVTKVVLGPCVLTPHLNIANSSKRLSSFQFAFQLSAVEVLSQIALERLRCEDASLYTSSRPQLRGSFPRLARHVEVQQLAATAQIKPSVWTLALTLHDVSSNGFADEPANFITRSEFRRCGCAIGMKCLKGNAGALALHLPSITSLT